MADCKCDKDPCENPDHRAGQACEKNMPFIMQKKVDAGWVKSSSGLICPACAIRNNPQIKDGIDKAQVMVRDVRKKLGLPDA